MDEVLQRILIDPVAEISLRQALDLAMYHFYAFVLVLIRMSGLMTIGPIFGQSLVPVNIRVLMVLCMTLLITPVLPGHTRVGFERLDVNGDGRLVREEVPQQLEGRFDELLASAQKNENGFLTLREFDAPLAIPPTILDLAWVGIAEFALGMVLGLGVLIILTGLQLAGELIDQQTGLALGEVANPGLDINSSMTGQYLFLFGLTVLLLMEPTGIHLLMISALVDTFQTLPVGSAVVSVDAIDLLRDLVQQSLVLGIQVAAPLLATMSLVALTMGFLGHTVPQINVLVIGFPIRVITSLLILIITMSGTAAAITNAVPGIIDGLRAALTGI